MQVHEGMGCGATWASWKEVGSLVKRKERTNGLDVAEFVGDIDTERKREREREVGGLACRFVPAWLPSLGWWAIAALRAPMRSVEGCYIHYSTPGVVSPTLAEHSVHRTTQKATGFLQIILPVLPL